ncbi:uncharacterized protein B0H18DRAFT_117774 [Fomitopsis serialis]|uniref:uncharacterized protein n=1 Tax=Fomitopsis serialis TaxID=139415 RepID=UPI0020079121|nr:uncharacterized protein B0H18DRAFT_117774 [Neoantrodia serialis]KAH9930875.1 hypothetical protein B0H18DRAFT_117774 [Neoantrodia serialis]
MYWLPQAIQPRRRLSSQTGHRSSDAQTSWDNAPSKRRSRHAARHVHDCEANMRDDDVIDVFRSSSISSSTSLPASTLATCQARVRSDKTDLREHAVSMVTGRLDDDDPRRRNYDLDAHTSSTSTSYYTRRTHEEPTSSVRGTPSFMTAEQAIEQSTRYSTPESLDVLISSCSTTPTSDISRPPQHGGDTHPVIINADHCTCKDVPLLVCNVLSSTAGASCNKTRSNGDCPVQVWLLGFIAQGNTSVETGDQSV